MSRADPEIELIRRAAPFAFPAVGLSFAAGAFISGASAGWSAAIGVAIVFANFVANGLSIAWAARISPVAIFAVGLGGFAVRLAVFAVAMLALNTLSWFSPVAFVAAFVPATAVLLGFEMKVMSQRQTQADLWYFREKSS